MTRTPHISIIIPTYNSARTLEACLKSIVIQTWKNYEVIILDGESKDDTIAIIKSFETKLSQLRWVSEKDNGIYDAMNKGVSLAKGQWLYFLGSDDVLFNDEVLEEISKKLKKDVVMLYGKALIVPDNFVTRINIGFEELMQFNLCHQAIFYSKDIFNKVKFNIKFPNLADWDLNLKIFASYPFSRIVGCDVIVCKFLNTGSSSNWKNTREYIQHFSSPVKMILRYVQFPRSIILAWRFIKARFKKRDEQIG